MRPSEEEAVALHRRHGSPPAVVEHCRTVAKLSKILADECVVKKRAVDGSLAVSGALLHDIGRSKVQTVWHGVEGARILSTEGVDDDVVEIVYRHVGAGISPDEARALGFPDRDYIPRTLEQRIVCFSDKMVDSSRVRPFEEEVKRFVAKKHDVPRLLALKKGLADDLGEDPESVIFDKIKESQ
ncbi:MAG TPA: HDIG domain-containing protein [Nitrososphaerales archaeon]|nr:HDIG domain-containing protein [Nitrososphaerales archaeon]